MGHWRTASGPLEICPSGSPEDRQLIQLIVIIYDIIFIVI